MTKFWLQTYTGVRFPLDEPRADCVFFEDIAHHLGHLCRYAGATRRFYSVAEHSVRVSRLVPAEHALTALLHDATEAYLADLPRPVKLLVPGYAALEDRVWRAIAERFGLPGELPACIHDADVLMLHAERRQLLHPRSDPDWGPPAPGPVPNVGRLGLEPQVATYLFKRRFAFLTAPLTKSVAQPVTTVRGM